jgi:hypothetical protein
MLTALILVCSLASVPDMRDCTEDNALHVVRDFETFASPVTCLMHGQAHLADTEIGRSLGEDEAIKVTCVRRRTAASPTAEEPATAQLQRSDEPDR